MKYLLKIVYFDDKELVLEIEKEELTEFFDALTARRMYKNTEGYGFWTHLENIRYITLVDEKNRMDAGKAQNQGFKEVGEEPENDQQEAS